MSVTDHFIPFGRQKHDSSVGVSVDLIHYVEFVGMDSCFLLDVAADGHEEAGEKAVEEAHASAWDYSLRYFLADRLQVRKWRIHDQKLAFLTQKCTDCSHAASPDCHLIVLIFQKFHRLIDLFSFLLPQRYVVVLKPVPTSSKIEAGQSDISRYVW